LAERGLRPKHSKGQCFLVDLNLLDVLLREAEVGPEDVVLEVGAGTGSLTRRLAERAAAVLSLELDRGFFELASEHVADCSNVTLICTDALKGKNRLNPVLVEQLQRLAPPQSPYRRKLVANLPYNIATPLLCLLLLRDEPWDRFVFTVQKEVADRLVAQPGTKQYGTVSVLVQAVADAELLRTLPPSVFWPQPKVHSAMVRIRPNPAKRAAIADLFARHWLRAWKASRRRMLTGCSRRRVSTAAAGPRRSMWPSSHACSQRSEKAARSGLSGGA
jgi:16S rRNA (adenine1518-N6/adenine1519-N6)-dimethyltransferase